MFPAISYDFKDDMKCKSPSANGYSCPTYSFLDIPTDTFAEQLTYIDSVSYARKIVTGICSPGQ